MISQNKELLEAHHWLSALQWLLFMFTNIVVIPLTVGAAFELSHETIRSLLQLSFILTGLACVLQGVIGHKRAIMEGNSGLWWGVFLALTLTTSAQGIPLEVLGGSLAVGIIISGGLISLIGMLGWAPYIATLFKPGVMGVFMFLFGCQLIHIFLKGMLGIPFGNTTTTIVIDLPLSFLSISVVVFIIIFSIKAPAGTRRYALLAGIIIGWIFHYFIFGSEDSKETIQAVSFSFFPLGKPSYHLGIIMVAVITGILNMANAFGALKGTEPLYQKETTKGQYRRSFILTGAFTGISGVLGLVPYAPYVSSLGFLTQTGIYDRLPFILGGLMFFMMGLIPPLGDFFSLLPLSIGSAALFVAYLQLFNSAWGFFSQLSFNPLNVYRVAIPLFVGIILMTLPSNYFTPLPEFIRPIINSGLLTGIILALILENILNWDRLSVSDGNSLKN